MRLEQAWIKHQEWLKPSLNRENIFSSYFSFFCSFSAGAWLLTPCSFFCKASVAWVRGNPTWGEHIALDRGCPSPGTVCCRWRMGCGTRNPPSPFLQTEPLRSFSPKLSQVLKHSECIFHLSKNVAWFIEFISVTKVNGLLLYPGYWKFINRI